MAPVPTRRRAASLPGPALMLHRLAVVAVLAALALVARWGCRPLTGPGPAGDADLPTLVAHGSRIAVGFLALWVLVSSTVALACELGTRSDLDPLPRGGVGRWIRLAWRGTAALTLLTPVVTSPVAPVAAAQTAGPDPAPTAGRADAPPVLVLLPDPATPDDRVRSEEADAQPGSGPPVGLTWTIGRGEHLWGVAERTLTWALGHPPDTATTARYLRALVAENREVLPVPDEPDLVFPGQVVVLPPLSVLDRLA